MKRKFGIRLLIILVAMFFSIIFLGRINKSNAAEVVGTWNLSADDGQSNVTATLYDDGNFVISGTGVMREYNDSADRGYFNNISEIEKVTVEQGVTNIGKMAFYCCDYLTKIEIPESITSIGEAAFRGCSSLISIEIPEGVTSIGKNAFRLCSSLTSIEIPKGVTSIENNTFNNCSRLTSIEIPEGVTSIGNNAFVYCKSLTSIELPEGVTSIGNNTFSNCSSLTSIEIPEGITSIGNSAFYSCSSLTSIEIPERVISIGNNVFMIGNKAFSGCTKLNKVKLPYGIENISTEMFYDCLELREVIIPNTVTTIEDKAFYGCSKLNNVDLSKKIISIGESSFEKCASIKSIEIPNGVSIIKKNLFKNCKSLSNIIIPDTITEIEDGAFEGCLSLEDINIPSNVIVGQKVFLNAQIKLNTVNDSEYKDIQLPDWIKNQIIINPDSYELIDCELNSDSSIKVNTKLFGNKTIKINDGIFQGFKIIISVNAINGHMPEFYGTTNITLRIGDELNLKNSYYRIFAKDYEDGNITKNIEVKYNNVNTSEAGNYQIIYEVTDSNNNRIRTIVPVQVIENGDRKIQRTLYTLPDASILNNTSFTRGNNHDIQDLGIYLPASKSFSIKQLNNLEKPIYVHLFNNDSAKENSFETTIYRMSEEIANDPNIGVVEYTAEELENVPADKIDKHTGTVKKSEMYSVKNIASSVQIRKDEYSKVSNTLTVQYKANYKKNQDYQKLLQYLDTEDTEAKNSFDSVPAIKTLYGVEEKPIIEIVLNDDIKPLDLFTYGDSTDEFINKWKESQNSFGLLEGNRTTFLVPIKDLEDLCKSKKEQNIIDNYGLNIYRHDDFTNIDQILNYYDNLVETYDNWIGLSDNPSNIYDLNVKSKMFIKANIHGAGGLAYVGWNYTYCTDNTIDTYLHKSGDGWAPFHEFGHGYQGYLIEKELYLGEISNNFFAYYIQKKLLGEDWLDDNVGDEHKDSLEKMMNAVRNGTILEENKKSFLEYYPTDINKEYEITGVNRYKSRLFAYINLLNKLDFEKVLPYTYSYCRALYVDGKVDEMSATDIIAKCFSEASGYNVIPYLESWNLTISEQVKKEIYDKDYPIVYYLKDIAGDSAENIKNTLQLKYMFYDEDAGETHLPYLYSTISNNDIDNYNLKGSVKLKLNDEEIDKLYGKIILIKSGNNVIRTVNINNNELNINDVPVGIYEIELEGNDYMLNKRNIIISENSNEEVDLSLNSIGIDIIKIEEYPTCRNYTKGSDLDLSGMKVKAIYNDGTYEYIDNYSIEGYDKNTVGVQEITVKYKGKEAKFKVIVNGIPVTGIEVTKAPTKTSYIKGEELNLEGIEITATYEDGTKKIIELQEESFIGYDADTVGEQTITVKYAEGITTTLNVTVVEKQLTEIKVTNPPSKMNYIEGERFDRAGMVVVAVYNDGSEKEIENYKVANGQELQLGQTSVTISYTEKGIAKTVEQEITVIKEEIKVTIREYEEIQENGVRYIEKIIPETSIGELKRNIETNGTIEIYKGNTKITNEEQLIATGMEVVIKFREQEVRYTIVVKGDLNGDGKIGIGDLSRLSRYAAGLDNTLQEAYLRASDVVKDGKYGRISDISKMSRVLAGLDNF